MNIRKCTDPDLPTLRQFYRNLFVEYGDPVPGEGVDGRLSEYSLCAEIDGVLVGYIIAANETIEFMKSEIGRSCFPGEKNYLEIQDLYVLPHFRNTGVGTALIQAVLTTAKSNGLKNAMVYSSNKDYVRTARFYEKSGFAMWHIFMTQKL